VFEKKEKGNGKVFARFRLKSQEKANKIINWVSFEFNRLGGSRLSKKTMQAMETETPMMLLFVCNGTDQSSIATNLRHMLDIAYEDIDEEGMMPEQYKNRDLPKFALRLNVPRLPEKKSAKDNKAYDHLREHGKKAFHLEVAKSDQEFFTFLANHAHRMGLDAKYFGKFAKLTVTLGKDAPLSDCSRLRRCIQGHLNYHLSSTLVAINGIEDLDASEIVCNPTTGMKVVRVSLRDILYKIKLSNKSPLFLQLSQRPSGEVDAVIPNTAEAENMAERINVQVAAWCHYYWRETNKEGERFFKKLAERAFNTHLNHEVSKCVWDAATHVVTPPRSLSEMSAMYKFESLNWVKDIVHAKHNPTKKHVDPTAAFNFEEDFSVGTIHGKNNVIHAALPARGRRRQLSCPTTTTLVSSCPRCRTTLMPSSSRSSAGARAPLETGLPPVPDPQPSALPPMLPLPERQGWDPSRQRDLRSHSTPTPMVAPLVGRVANSC
jgi:hypothetical protein